jgi:dipeptidyl aminopeptidase/acylaminoacyl peptidase
MVLLIQINLLSVDIVMAVFLTNWLITQTTRFNAVVTGAGVVELVYALGQVDMPIFIYSLFGGYPWEMPQKYFNESPISYLRQVRTLTHMMTGEKDMNVDISHSKLLERGLHYLGVFPYHQNNRNI